MSKSLQKCILFAVCIALVCALGVTLFIFDGTGGAVTGQEGQASGVADAAANAYEHGGNIGRTASGEQVTDASGFMTALRSNKTINLQNNITLSSSDAFPRSADGYVLSYSSTIYGNGHTISFTGRHSEGSGEWANPTNSSGAVFDWKQTVNYYGGIVGQLAEGGHIYDLNVVMTSGNIAFKSNDEDSGDTWLDVGGIAGIVESGASIENCTFTISQENSRLASLKWPETTWLEPANQWGRAGGIAGELNGGSIINCTVTNNGSIEAGDSGQYDYVTGATYRSAVGNIVGWIGSGTIQNVRVSGSGSLNAFKVGNIGVLKSGSTISTQNFYNNFSGTFNVLNSTNGGSSSSAYDAQNGSKSATITNMFTENNATSGSVTGTVNTINNTSNIPSSRNYSVYFDPKQGTNYGNSLAIAFNQAPAASYEYTLVSGNGTTYENPETTSSAIVFRNLPTAAATWNSGGTFTATLNSELLFNDYLSDIAVYEHGYVADGSETSDGTPISTSAEWDNIFSPTGTGDTSGNYYLTGDIVISGFTGKTFSGTLDGNGNTIYIIDTFQDSYDGGNSGFGRAVGGLAGVLTGTIKNVRVAFVNLGSTNTINVNMSSTGVSPRIGLVAGVVNGGTIKNVQAYVENGVTVNGIKAADNSVAMGGIAGYATANAAFTDVTLYLDGTLAPTGSYQYLGGIVGLIDNENGATFTDVAIRGTGTFAGTAGNTEGEPTYYGAIAVIQADSTNITSAYATVNGLIYDFDVTLAGTGGGGQSNNSYSCYYLFTNNYNAGASGGWVSENGAISGYNGAVSYSNVFVNSAYKDKLAEYAQQRTNGNAAVGVAEGVINTVQNKVEGLENPVAAYFNPVDGADDMIFRASGSWDEDRMVILALSDGTVRESVLETAGDRTSAKLVYAPKALAATDNVVQLTLYENVNWPTAPAALTYNGAEQSFAFTLQTVSGTPVESGDYTVAYSVQGSDTGVLGENNLPLNAGTYTATIRLTNGKEFIDDGQGTTSPEYSLTVKVNPFKVEGTWTYNGGLTLTYGDPVPSDIDQYISVTLTSTDIPGGLTSVTASGFTTDYTQGTAAGTTVNIFADTYAVNSGLMAGNYDFTGITGSGSLEVQKKELTITDLGDDASHIKDSYGSNVTSLEDLATLFETEGMNYVQGVYENQAVTFTITAFTYDRYYDDGAGGASEEGADATSLISGRLYAKTYYTATVTLASDNAVNDNYELAEGSTFVYYIEPLVIEITGAEFAGGGISVLYDGNAHEIQVVYTGALDGDNLTFTTNVFYNSESFEGTALTNAGEYTIDVSFDPQNAFHGEANYNYDIGVDGSENTPYTLTISPITLTISDKSGVYTDFVAADIVIDDMVSGILEGDTEGVTITPAWDTPLADEDGWLAANTYNATLSLGGDKAVNYTFGSDNVATVTVSPFDLSVAQVTITSAPFTYNGNEQTVLYTVLTAEDGKDITALLTAEGDKQTNANAENAKYTVTLSGDDNFTGTAAADWSIAQKTLTISPFTADFLDYESSGSLYTHLTNKDSGLITGVIDGDTITFSGVWATTPATAEGTSYVAAGNYVLNMNEPGNANYKFENNAMSVTINALDISGAEVAATWNESLTYTAEEQSVSLASVTVNDVALPVEWFNLTNNTGTDADTYTANIAANNSNITGSATADFTIAPASVTVKWEVTGEISVGKVMPETATDMDALGLTANVTEFTAPGITGTTQYSIVVTASGFDAGHTFAAGEKVTLTPSMNFGQGAAEDNYDITFDPATVTKTVAATPVTVKPVNGEQTVIYGSSVKSAEEFIAAAYFTIESGAEGTALTADNFTVTVMGENGEAVFGTHGLAAGTYTVTIEGKGAYSVSNEDNSFTYNVDPLTLTAGTWSGVDNLTYDGTAAAPVFTPGGVLGGDEVTVTVTVTGDKVTSGQAVNAGAYTATAESDNVNYKFDGVANVKEFTIAQMVLSGDWEVDSDMDMTYDGTDKSAYVTWTWTVAPLNDGDVTFEITFNGEKTAVNAGNYTATVTFTDSTGNYDTQSGILQGNKYDSMTIKPRPVEITWTAPADLTYSAEAKVPTATISNKVGTDEVTATITYNGNNTDVTAEGFTATVTELTGAAKDNYTLEGGTGITSEKYTITALDVPYEWSFADSAAITYGDGVDKVKALVTLPDGTLLGTEEKVTFEVSVDYSGTTSAGSTVTFTVTAKLPEGVNEANYNITVTAKDGNNTLTVDKAQITFTGNAVTEQKIAGGTLTLTAEQLLAGKYYTIAPAPDSTYSVSGKLSVTRVENSSGQEITADANGYTFTEEGEYTVTYAVSSEESDNYAPAAETFTATLTVSEDAISLTPTWDEYTFTYNGTAQYPVPTFNQTPDEGAIVYTVTARGDSALTDNSAVNAGDYTVTISVAEGFAQKYEFAENATLTFDFTIGRLEAKLSWSEEDATYDGQAHILTATVSNKAAGDDVTVQVELTDGDNTNVTEQGYYFTATGLTGAAAGNYKLPAEVRSGKFYIEPAELTVATANTSFTYGDNIDLGATVVNAIGDDDVSVAIDSVVSGGEPAELKNAGSYTVTYRLEGAAAGNYTIAEGGSVDVTVKAKELTFTWNSDQTFTYNREAQVPGYTLNGVVDGDEVTITVTVKGDNATEGQAINAGVYTASVADITEGNYSLTGVQQFPFTIGRANLTLTPESVKFSDSDADMLSAYSKTNYEATIKTNVTVTGVGSDAVFNDFTVTTDDDSFTGENGTLAVGEYTFTVSVASGNYNDATYTVTVIEQPVAEFTATPSSRTYTGGEITFTFANEEGIQLEEGVQITVSGITFNNASAASVLDAGSYTVTFAVTGNSADNNYRYTVSDWNGSISPATVTANADTAVYGDVYTAQTGGNLQNDGEWQFVTFNGSPVKVTVTDATARAGETYLGAGTYNVTVTLVSGNFTFAGDNSSVASTLQITPKQLNIAAQLPEDLTYTSEGIVIGLEDYASQLVGDDNVTVSMLVDGKPYVAGVTVLGAGQHTVTVTMTDTFGNYRLAAAQQTFTVEKKPVSSSITVSGETIENNSSLEIVHGENARVQNAIDNYLTQNGVEEGEYTLTVTNSAGQAADLDNISAWAPGTYTVNLGLSDNFEGGMTFTIVVQEGTTAQIPDAPVLPSTPLEDGGSSGVANWLFPLIIAIECLIAIALIVAIAVSAARRSKNS